MHLFRVILPVTDIERAATFYGRVLGSAGRRVSPGRHYFDAGAVIVACYEPRGDGDACDIGPNPEHIYFAVADLEAVFDAVRGAGCQRVDDAICTQPWGERSLLCPRPLQQPDLLR